MTHSLSYRKPPLFLNPGALAPYLDEFTAELDVAGYSASTICIYRSAIAHFGHWLQRQQRVVDAVDRQTLHEFGAHRCRCLGGRQRQRLSPKYIARVRRFITYLSTQGVIDTITDDPDELPADLAAFGQWLCVHRGLSTRTIDRYLRLASRCQQHLGENAEHYTPAAIRQVVCAEAERYSLAQAKCVATALRVYLRFLAAHGRCRPGLDAAVPTIAHWQLSTLPRYLVADDIERVIASCNLDSAIGRRDHAVLLLLARLGLRAGDLARLRLCDIDWIAGTLRVTGKARQSVCLPLPQEVGDALLVYLETARPAVAVDAVFFCMTAPLRPMATSSGFYGIVRSALIRAGIDNPPAYGPHLLRHSAATALLRAGTPIDAIAALLRHRSLDMTAYYAKVDVDLLREIAQPWPEGAPC